MSKTKLNTWIVYYQSQEGDREGMEIIQAISREEAISIYRRFFNVQGPVVCVPRIEIARC